MFNINFLKLVKPLKLIAPALHSKLLVNYHFKNLQIAGESTMIEGPILINNAKRISIGNNLKVESDVSIDARGGIAIGDNVLIQQGASLNTSILKNGKVTFSPIVIQDDFVVEQGKLVEPGKFAGNCNFDKGLLNYTGELVFVVGTGRSGTNSISALINSVDNCVCYHDPFPHISIWSSELLYKICSSEEICLKLKSLFNTVNPRENDVVGQSDQKFSAVINELYHIFPKAKFLWLIRNGEDFVNSAYPRGWFRNEEFGFSENKSEFYEAKAKPSQMHANNRTNGFLLGEMSSEEWKEMTAFERNCWYWSFWNSMIEDKLNKIPSEQKLFLRLEDLSENMEQLSSFINREIRKPIERTNKANYSRLSTDSWTVEMKEIFNLYCKENMTKWYPDFE